VSGRPGRLGRDLAAWRRASRARCQRSTVSAAPAAGTSQARPLGTGAAERPGTPGRQGRTAVRSYPAAAPAPRSGDVAPGSPPPCPGGSPQAAAVTRTRSSHPDRPIEAAQPIIMPQAEPLGETSSSGAAKIHIQLLSPGRMSFRHRQGRTAMDRQRSRNGSAFGRLPSAWRRWCSAESRVHTTSLRTLQARASTMPNPSQLSSGSARTARSMDGAPGTDPGACAADAPMTALRVGRGCASIQAGSGSSRSWCTGHGGHGHCSMTGQMAARSKRPVWRTLKGWPTSGLRSTRIA